MSGGPSDRSRDGVDFTAFEEWVEQIADENGMSKQEVIDRMMSSYWIMDEFVGMVDESPEGEDDETSPPVFKQDQRRQPNNTDTADSAGEETQNDVEALLESIQDLQDELQTKRSTQPTDSKSHTGHEPSAPDNDRTHSGDAQTPTSSPQSPAVGSEKLTQIETQMQWLASELDRIESEYEQSTSHLEEQVTELMDEVERLSHAIENAAEPEDLETLSEQVDSDLEDLSAQIEQVQTKVSTEFGNLSDILEHFVTRDNQLESGIETLARRYQTDIASLLEHKKEQTRLQELKQASAQKGIQTAKCNSCNQSVDIQTLAKPRCPSCDMAFGSISEKDSWFFGSHTLVTAPEQSPPDLEEIGSLLDQTPTEQTNKETQSIEDTQDDELSDLFS